jgi:hypothetical protein
VRHTWSCMRGLSKWVARSIEFLQECTCTSSKFFFLASQRNTKVARCVRPTPSTKVAP